MKVLNPDKLSVEYRQGVSPTEPIIGRKYTLTHSDVTAQLFLTISVYFAYDKINATRDEVFAEWGIINGNTLLYVYVSIDGPSGPSAAPIRNTIFRRELPLALEAIRYGDNKLFITHPELDNAQIWVHFNSANPDYNKFEKWGVLSDYK